MKIFDTQPKPGTPVRHPMFFTALLRMARAWEKLAVHNGHVDWSNGMPTIVVDEPTDILPARPTTGDYVLTCQDGVMSWVELSTFICP